MTPKISFEELLVRNELDQKPVVSVEGDQLYLIEGRGEYAGGTRLETPEKIDAVRERCDDDNVNAVTTSAVTTPPSATTSAETNADAPVQKAMNKGSWSEEEKQRAVAAANEFKSKSKYGAYTFIAEHVGTRNAEQVRAWLNTHGKKLQDIPQYLKQTRAYEKLNIDVDSSDERRKVHAGRQNLKRRAVGADGKTGNERRAEARRTVVGADGKTENERANEARRAVGADGKTGNERRVEARRTVVGADGKTENERGNEARRAVGGAVGADGKTGYERHNEARRAKHAEEVTITTKEGETLDKVTIARGGEIEPKRSDADISFAAEAWVKAALAGMEEMSKVGKVASVGIQATALHRASDEGCNLLHRENVRELLAERGLLPSGVHLATFDFNFRARGETCLRLEKAVQQRFIVMRDAGEVHLLFNYAGRGTLRCNITGINQTVTVSFACDKRCGSITKEDIERVLASFDAVLGSEENAHLGLRAKVAVNAEHDGAEGVVAMLETILRDKNVPMALVIEFFYIHYNKDLRYKTVGLRQQMALRVIEKRGWGTVKG
ncbi:myb DNA binding domain-containing protein [Micromonas pusilla CCMP1545]|uniref:Myb DNA binding domain-containing protein n=1 Tax=Micromonas pusilla (strain CCMP1545) TaxID=564608 RepID=C1MWK0_MICPC|nr:myb DNA binding domain-containing protein [Micromonas pusilla CCMP1545]EEH56184.1 myb DNA binding domain-containing protein [Micromonas pusilla CCMP1545]|eukprot:XP_003060232.1 myb DNA binding domain-containing protein [Micromonas pusilla CCMP1545]